MQIILFRKSGSESIDPSIVNFDPTSLSTSLVNNIQPGRILLIKKSDFKKIEVQLREMKLMNCGIKADKDALNNALKLSKLREKATPGRLLVNFKSVAALRRSINQFISKHYEAADPACILFIDDILLEELSSEITTESRKLTTDDPISNLVNDAEKEEIVQQISTVYIGSSYYARLTRAFTFKASQSVKPVLIIGESGTGKDVIAREIFKYSLNYKKSFITVNCSSIPDSLFEAEAYGYLKGSFTDAKQDRKGFFEAAHEGTLFLDEIGDLSLSNQAKLLRALQSGEIKPLGSPNSLHVDLRLISATNRNLSSLIKQGKFRSDLYFRLNTINVISYPLREHPDDIPLIAKSIWKNNLGRKDKLSDEFLNYLKEYTWPGNVRELKTLLNSISDLFTNDSPRPEHIIQLRAYQKNTLLESDSRQEDDFESFLKAQCRARVITLHNIIRAIKIVLRPFISSQTKKLTSGSQHKIKEFLRLEIVKLEDLCREPIYFKSREFFDQITRFRYLLDNLVQNWPSSPNDIHQLWKSKLSPLYDGIDQEIFNIIWHKVDL
jgi:transcriptional regulator with PAS, ATPase and Fis domain